MKPKPKSVASPSPCLVGQYFHSVTKDTGQICWQGQVVGTPEPGWYLLQLYEYLMGEPNVRRLARIEEMEAWLFYPDVETMRFSYEHSCARPGGPYRKAETPS